MNTDCFSWNKNCGCLTETLCAKGDMSCPFYKTNEQIAKEDAFVKARLSKLPKEQIFYIYGKYNLGEKKNDRRG